MIVVGNVSVGGTGKTPFVIWLADQLKQRGRKVGIVDARLSRQGHRVAARRDCRRAIRSEVGDEPVLLARRTGCPVVAGPDRVACVEASARACARRRACCPTTGCSTTGSARAFEIAVVDGARGMGNGLCLPAGPLREPVVAAQEVDAIVVNGGEWGHAGVFRAAGRRHEGLALEGRRGAHARVVSQGSPCMPSPASAIRSDFSSCSSDADLEVDRRIRSTDHAEIDARESAFDEPGAVLITEKDAVKCEQLRTRTGVVRRGRFQVRRRYCTARLMRVVDARHRSSGP